MSAFDEYRESVASARTWFDNAHPNVLTAIDVLNGGFTELARCLQIGRDANNRTHVGLGPLLLILQRQAFVAMDLLASRQAYQAWLIVRPGLEAGLFIGKWLDDVNNYIVWAKREDDYKTYAREYSGTRLRSTSLPRSDELQTSLKTINDLFAHPNPDYLHRHTKTEPMPGGSVFLKLSFFDSDRFHWASVLGLLHLLIAMQDAIARAFARVFVNIDHNPEGYGLRKFQDLHREQAKLAASEGAAMSQIIFDIGLWHLAED